MTPVTSSAVGVAYLCLSADNALSHRHPYSFQSRQPSPAIFHTPWGKHLLYISIAAVVVKCLEYTIPLQ